jgi:choline dehydrogenase
MPIDLTPPVLADRRMSRTANHAATVVVVGAGSAGMPTAWRLSAEPSTHVILIDAGADPGPAVPDSLRREMLLPPEYYWGYAEADTGAFLPRGKVLGGTSAANAAAAVRGHPRCFDAWGPGWTWEDCLPAFIGLESDRQFGSQPYHGDTGPIPITRYPTDGFDAEFNDAYMAMGHCAIEDHNKPDCLGFAPWPTNRVGDDRASTLLQLLPPLRTRSNVTILPRTQVRRVLIDGQTAVGVLVDTPNGPEVVESDSMCWRVAHSDHPRFCSLPASATPTIYARPRSTLSQTSPASAATSPTTRSCRWSSMSPTATGTRVAPVMALC